MQRALYQWNRHHTKGKKKEAGNTQETQLLIVD